MKSFAQSKGGKPKTTEKPVSTSVPSKLQTKIWKYAIGSAVKKDDTGEGSYYRVFGVLTEGMPKEYQDILYSVAQKRIDKVFGLYSDDVTRKFSFDELVALKERKFGTAPRRAQDDPNCMTTAKVTLRGFSTGVISSPTCKQVAIWEDEYARFILWEAGYTLTDQTAPPEFYGKQGSVKGVGIISKHLQDVRHGVIQKQAKIEESKRQEEKAKMGKALENE